MADLNDVLNRLDKLIALIVAGAPGPDISPSGTPARSFYAWLDEWLKDYKAPALKPSSLASLSMAVRVHVKPNIPDMPL